MRQRPVMNFRPGLDRFEERQLLSASPVTTHVANAKDGSSSVAHQAVDVSGVQGKLGDAAKDRAASKASADRKTPLDPGVGFLAFRVTQRPYVLVPPFQQVLVQGRKPVPGKVYNVCQISVKNGTAQTFNANSGFTVRMSNQPRSFSVPILTGTQTWKPGQVIVFYTLNKRYYPVSFVAGGFMLQLGGRSSTLVPGPSSIFLRLKYDPAKFAQQLNWIVAFGQGNQLGLGAKVGIPNTSINEFVSANTQRIDYGGHF